MKALAILRSAGVGDVNNVRGMVSKQKPLWKLNENTSLNLDSEKCFY